MMEATSPVLNVSRETHARLEEYVALLLKWTARINLVSKHSAEDVWTRHIADSAQLISLAPGHARRWLDMGSGGGLPGLVVAIMAAESSPGLRVTLLEADERKAAFLQTVTRDLGLSAETVIARIEDAPSQGADVISARALAPLSQLMGYAEKHRAEGAICLFPKGRSYREELTQARSIWHLEPEVLPSTTDPEAVLLRIGEFSRV